MRNGIRSLIIVLLAGLTAGALQAAEPGHDPNPKVTAPPSDRVLVTAGKKTKVELPFRVNRGYHINSSQPKSELLVPTKVTFRPPTNISVGAPEYPLGKDLSFPFAPEEKLNVYTGDFMVRALVSAARNTPPGTYRVRGQLRYQACDDRACYPPTELPLYFDVTVKKAPPSGGTRRNPAQSPHIHR